MNTWPATIPLWKLFLLDFRGIVFKGVPLYYISASCWCALVIYNDTCSCICESFGKHLNQLTSVCGSWCRSRRGGGGWCGNRQLETLQESLVLDQDIASCLLIRCVHICNRKRIKKDINIIHQTDVPSKRHQHHHSVNGCPKNAMRMHMCAHACTCLCVNMCMTL